jgi:Ca2+-binding EF-hand superfamily protein
MPGVVEGFEAELRNKLAFKASSKISADSLLVRLFKFFDLHETGELPFQEFFRGVAKAGVVLGSQEHMRVLFDHYDARKAGRINYREFTAQVLRLELEQAEEAPAEPQGLDDYLAALHSTMIAQGLRGLIQLGLRFKAADQAKSHHADVSGFTAALRGAGLGLREAALQEVFLYFDKDRDGYLNYAEFLYSLRGAMSPFREGLTKSIFEQLDKEAAGEVQVALLLKSFEGPQDEFREAVGLYNQFQGIEDGVFTEDDFLDFMGFVSYVFEGDEGYREFVTRGWPAEDRKSAKSVRSRREYSQQEKEDNKSVAQKLQAESPGQSEPRSPLKETDFRRKENEVVLSRKDFEKEGSVTTSVQARQIEMIVLRMKSRLAARGPMGYLSFLLSMHTLDSDSDGLLALAEFRKCVKDHRIEVTDTEIKQVFDLFDDRGLALVPVKEVF